MTDIYCKCNRMLENELCPSCNKKKCSCAPVRYELRVHQKDSHHGWGIEFISRIREETEAFRSFVQRWIYRQDVSEKYFPFLQCDGDEYIFVECWKGDNNSMVKLVEEIRREFEMENK